MLFKIYECMRPIFSGKPFHRVMLVLPYTLYQVAGYAGIQGSVTLARKDMNGGFLFDIFAGILDESETACTASVHLKIGYQF